METFTSLKAFISNPGFCEQRQIALEKLDITAIDEPLIDLIEGFAKLRYCFTLQCCYGHFVAERNRKQYSISELYLSDTNQKVEYRLAYLALCIEDSEQGQNLLHRLAKIRDSDPNMIQLGCCEWFWERQINSFTIQVEPKRYQYRDRIAVKVKEAIKIGTVRNRFFEELRKLVLLS